MALMLDDLEYINKIDKSNMLGTVSAFPEQIKDAIRLVKSINVTRISEIANIIIVGMGGSAISGDILSSYLRDITKIPIFVNRDYSLPAWANQNTLAFFLSYSGNTEETLNSFQDAHQKKCKIIGISSGGKLQDFCQQLGVKHIRIKTGFQPRVALAYLLFPTLTVLQKTGLIKENVNPDIEEAIQITTDLRNNSKKEIVTKENVAKQLAQDIHNTVPQIYGWGAYAPIARRWRTQFNENSKIIAREDIIPECNHNDIVGWSHNLEASKRFTCILFRDKKNETPNISKRLNFMKNLYKQTAYGVIEIQTEGETLLARMMYLLLLGDFLSCYLAVLRKIDPTPVDIITDLKKILGKN
ncbi:bifunctional phosphoglucose/phosphomannose isomerase [Thermoplasmatales archaeon SCGC AB-539-N05]|nr:bifunctional phosphoglucose/phosphomannose isomerase [Thermoplasmatales archaeon SCGC AB-539-N05]